MRRALVTGGARGIGLASAHALAGRGYAVTVTGLTEEEIAALPAGSGLAAKKLDVTDEASVAACIGGFDELDVLINCAGMILRGGAEFELDNFRRVLDVNLVGTMRMCVAAKPLLARRGGAIVNLASMLSFFGGPLTPAYSASKGGIAQLTKSLAGAWAKENIRVNAVAPGWIETDLTRPLVEDPTRTSAILARTPMRRWGAPDDVAGAVAFLCSDEARFVTGVILPVDGGYLAL